MIGSLVGVVVSGSGVGVKVTVGGIDVRVGGGVAVSVGKTAVSAGAHEVKTRIISKTLLMFFIFIWFVFTQTPILFLSTKPISLDR